MQGTMLAIPTVVPNLFLSIPDLMNFPLQFSILEKACAVSGYLLGNPRSAGG